MKTYVRIDGGKVVEIIGPAADSDGAETPIDARFHPDFVATLADVTDVTPAPQSGWTATQTAGAWTFAAPADASAPTWADCQNEARALLVKSDMVAMRCLKNRRDYPVEWSIYDDQLRVIVGATSGDTSKPLPKQPEYPAGT